MASPLKLADRGVLQPLLASCNLMLSEYSFANLYLFRNVHTYKLVEADLPYITGQHYDKSPFIMPTSKLCFDYLLQKGLYPLFPIPQEWLDVCWRAESSSAESDYIFETHTLATYQGRHLSKKRNLVKQFREHYISTSRKLTPETQKDAEKVLVTWRDHQEADFDLEPCREALMLLEELHLEGTLYYVDDTPVGFILGEPLTADTFVIHFAKADLAYKGIYQYMYQAYAQSLSFRYINMEQDMGIESLKQSKHSYEPIKIVPKYSLFPK